MGAPCRPLDEKRKNRDAVILLTGATGFLGSHLALSLLASGFYLILLARPKNGKSAAERFRQVFDWFGGHFRESVHYTVMEGCLGKKHFGLSDELYDTLCQTIDEVVHCAADTEFLERKRLEVERGNVGTMHNLLAFLAESHAGFLHHISTAYVAGKTAGICREEIGEPPGFFNVYEETKHRAEVLAQSFCATNGIRLSIYRPTIVYGDSETGRSRRFNAMYFPVRIAVFLRDLFADSGGKKLAELGMARLPDGRIHMPLRLRQDPRGSMNLIPVNYFVEAFRALHEDATQGGIFNLACPEPVSLDTLVRFTSEKFAIEGVVTRDDDGPGPASNPLEAMFESYIEAYRHYMLDRRLFATDRALSYLRSRNVVCPRFSYDVFSRCMDYAVAVDWGKNIEGGP